MGKPQAPEIPDPVDTSAASTSTNIGTAIANTQMGQVNQSGPFGSLSYSQTGSRSYTDPYTGRVYELPQYTATTSLSPEMQQLFSGFQGAIGDRLGQLGQSYDTQGVEQRLFDLGNERLSPVIEQQRAALETRLANQGLAPGSAAWKAEMSQFNQRQNDAYNQLALQGRGQAFGEMMAQRQAPINEIAALLSGQQMATPQYQIAQPSRAPTTDVAGLINNNYNQQYQQYQNQYQARQQMMGGLFGLAAGLI